MSIVRYVNKKTGIVSLYESTSHYDPETKQSRPIRKYLGTENPDTGELIPTTGKRGRKRGSVSKKTDKPERTDSIDYKLQIEKLRRECIEKDARIKSLESKNAILCADLERIQEMITHILDMQ
jgi:hypothetical protein